MRFNQVLLDSLTRTEPSGWSSEHWRELLRGGRPDDLPAEAADTRQRSAT